ncbi:unnamed protein product [Effrenium voratum]|nr:unnamed protein product [Effrenium voratum]
MLLASLFKTQGRALVVVSPQDAPAAKVAEAYLRSVPLGAASLVSPDALEKAKGEYGLVFGFGSDPKAER